MYSINVANKPIYVCIFKCIVPKYFKVQVNRSKKTSTAWMKFVYKAFFLWYHIPTYIRNWMFPFRYGLFYFSWTDLSSYFSIRRAQWTAQFQISGSKFRSKSRAFYFQKLTIFQNNKFYMTKEILPVIFKIVDSRLWGWTFTLRLNSHSDY